MVHVLRRQRVADVAPNFAPPWARRLLRRTSLFSPRPAALCRRATRDFEAAVKVIVHAQVN